MIERDFLTTALWPGGLFYFRVRNKEKKSTHTKVELKEKHIRRKIWEIFQN